MGNCNLRADAIANSTKDPLLPSSLLPDDSSSALINKNSFTFHYVIGRGGFGKVWRVEKKKNGQLYAMKQMSKARIITKRSVNSVLNERKLLA